MSDKPICRKCSGSGEFANGGPCFNCNGTGHVGDMSYVTTSAAKSSHPAMRYEREHPEITPIPANPAHVERELEQLRALVAYEEETPVERLRASPWKCQHVFIGKMSICECGMWEQQFLYSINAPLEIKQGFV